MNWAIINGILAALKNLQASWITSGRFGKDRLQWTTDKLLKGAGAGADPTEIDPYADSNALAAAVQAGAITDGVTKAPTHDAVYDVKTTADAALPAAQKGAASGVASLDASSKVVQDPASAVSTATANKVVIRDANARAAFAAPSAAGDAAILSTVTDHAALTSPHSAVATATASRIVVRDASARAAFAAPNAAGDALIKGTRVTVAELPALTDEKFWKGTGGNVEEIGFGTAAGTVAEGNHTHTLIQTQELAADHNTNETTDWVTKRTVTIAATKKFNIWILVRPLEAGFTAYGQVLVDDVQKLYQENSDSTGWIVPVQYSGAGGTVKVQVKSSVDGKYAYVGSGAYSVGV